MCNVHAWRYAAAQEELSVRDVRGTAIALYHPWLGSIFGSIPDAAATGVWLAAQLWVHSLLCICICQDSQHDHICMHKSTRIMAMHMHAQGRCACTSISLCVFIDSILETGYIGGRSIITFVTLGTGFSRLLSAPPSHSTKLKCLVLFFIIILWIWSAVESL